MEAEATFRALFTRAYPALVRYGHFRGLEGNRRPPWAMEATMLAGSA
jgi:hypothetical protein